MKKTFVNAALAAATLISATAMFTISASAQGAAPTAPRGWVKECSKSGDNDVCIVQNILQAPTGQLITGVGLVDVKGKVNQRLFQVTVPTARMIPPGISMQVDGGQAVRVPYNQCFPDRCIARIELTDALVNSFKKGSEVVFTSVNFRGDQAPIPISLAGFTDAYDGEPIARSDKEALVKARNEEIKQKLAENRKKLQEAQEAAKTAE